MSTTPHAARRGANTNINEGIHRFALYPDLKDARDTRTHTLEGRHYGQVEMGRATTGWVRIGGVVVAVQAEPALVLGGQNAPD